MQTGDIGTLRSIKNRFGAVNELGIFAMTDQGLKDVANPSAIFLNRAEIDTPGSIVDGDMGGYATAPGRGPSAGGSECFF